MTEHLVTNPNIARLCRCCATEYDLMYDIFYGTCSNAQTYREVIMECAPVKLFRGDGLPYLICHECISILESFVMFRKKCVESELIFKWMYKNISANEQETLDSNRVKQTSSVFDTKEASNEPVTDFDDPEKSSVSEIRPELILCDKIKIEDTIVVENRPDTISPNDRLRSEIDWEFIGDFVNSKEESVDDYHDESERSYVDVDRKEEGAYVHSCDRCDRPYPCVECKKSFDRKNHLEKHRKIHAGDKRHSCDECEKSFVSKSSLALHQREHTGEKSSWKPYSPDKRTKSFACKERRHTCDECKKAFNFKSHLVEHRRAHRGDRLFSCDLQIVMGSSNQLEREPLDIDREVFDLLQLDEEDESDAEIVISDHNTDTEQSHSENSDDDRLNYENDNNNYLVGKDKETRWELNPPDDQKAKTKEANIITQPAGAKGFAKGIDSIDDIWKLFFPPSAVQEIVTYTNVHLEKFKTESTRAQTSDIHATNVDEIYALIGLLYLIGLKHGSHVSLREFWCTDGTAPDIFRAVMSMKRFNLLLAALRFDDVRTREERKTYDSLAPIRKFSDDFIERCQKLYAPGVFLTVGEMLESFRGRCKFRQYVADKHAKYGIKIYALVDSTTLYTLKMEIYAGKQPDGPYRRSDSASDLVKRLSAPVLDTGRNLTMGSCFTSVALARDLLENHRTTTVGTIRKDEKELPREFSVTRKRSVASSRFAFSNECTLVSYVPKRNKNVLVLSTMHRSNKIDADTGPKMKPEILTFYDATKGAVDTVDGLKGNYTTARETSRWPMVIFYSFLNISGINAQVIYRSNGKSDSNLTRREFLKRLAFELVRPHLVGRLREPRLTVELRQNITKIAGLKSETPAEEDPLRGAANKVFCSFCPRRKNRKTKKKCGHCSSPICNEHSAYLCVNCESRLVGDG